MVTIGLVLITFCLEIIREERQEQKSEMDNKVKKALREHGICVIAK